MDSEVGSNWSRSSGENLHAVVVCLCHVHFVAIHENTVRVIELPRNGAGAAPVAQKPAVAALEHLDTMISEIRKVHFVAFHGNTDGPVMSWTKLPIPGTYTAPLA
jgi:hypothetical protein